VSTIYTEYPDAESFLAVARPALERQECANGLMLGVCLRLVDQPLAYGSQPYFATVASAGGLRVAAAMTPPFRLLAYAEDDCDSAALELVADALLRGKWPVPGVLARQAVAEAFASLWRSKAGAGCSTSLRLRLYELRQVVHPRYPPGEFRPAAVEDIPLVRQWACGFHEECFRDEWHEQSMKSAEEKVKSGGLFLWVDGVPASMAARTRPTPHGESVSFVYTPPGQREKGYATAVVAHLSQRILDAGKQFCTLYADLGNPTSNSIYQRIGYTAVADVVQLDFEREAANPEVQPARNKQSSACRATIDSQPTFQ
jgi:predicted GNAT family acetyltransferase